MLDVASWKLAQGIILPHQEEKKSTSTVDASSSSPLQHHTFLSFLVIASHVEYVPTFFENPSYASVRVRHSKHNSCRPYGIRNIFVKHRKSKIKMIEWLLFWLGSANYRQMHLTSILHRPSRQLQPCHNIFALSSTTIDRSSCPISSCYAQNQQQTHYFSNNKEQQLSTAAQL